MDDLNNKFNRMSMSIYIHNDITDDDTDIDYLASKMAEMSHDTYFDKDKDTIVQTNIEQMNIIGDIMMKKREYIYSVDNPTNMHLKNLISYFIYLKNKYSHDVNFAKSFDYESLLKEINSLLVYNHKKYNRRGDMYIYDIYYVLSTTNSLLTFHLENFIS